MARRTFGGVGGHRVERTVAVGAVAVRGATRHLGVGVALGASLFEVLAVKGDARVATVRFQPGGEKHAAQDVTRGMAGVALLCEPILAEPVNALVATPAILGEAQVGYATRLHSSGVAGSAGELGVVVEQRKTSLGVVESLVSARVLPVDDIELASLVLRMAVQAGSGECRVQTALFGQLVLERLVVVAVEALGIGDTVIGLVALLTAVRIVQGSVTLVERPGRHPEERRLRDHQGKASRLANSEQPMPSRRVLVVS